MVRGGLNLPEQFEGGSGVTIDDQGRLAGVSVNCAPGKSVEELGQGIPNGQIGVTTVGYIRRAGGQITPDPTILNPDHCKLSGISAYTASRLFTPTITNPGRLKKG